MSIRFLFIQVGLIFALSILASYQVPDLSQANWDTVLFLTPYGIFTNFLNRESSVLWSFYGDLSNGQLSLSPATQISMFIVYICLILNAFKIIKQSEKKI